MEDGRKRGVNFKKVDVSLWMFPEWIWILHDQVHRPARNFSNSVAEIPKFMNDLKFFKLHNCNFFCTQLVLDAWSS